MDLRVESHPLEIVHILLLVFKNATIAERKVYRLVCKSWLKASTSSEFQETVIHFDGRNDGASFRPISNIVVDNSSYLYTNERYCPREVLVSHKVMDSLRMWKQCGMFLTSLDLLNVQFESINDFRRVLNYCGNLKKLALRRCEVARNGTRRIVNPTVNRNLKELILAQLSNERFQISWLELFRRFPCLESLWIWTEDTLTTVCIYRDLELMLKTQDPRGLAQHSSNLRELRLNFCGRYEALRIGYIMGSEIPIHLERLHVYEFKDKFAHNIGLHIILRRYADTLLELAIVRKGIVGEGRCNIHFRYPMLNNLQKLRIELDAMNWIDFSRSTPNIRKLVLYNTNLPITSRFSLGQFEEWTLETCNELHLSFCNESEDSIQIDRLSRAHNTLSTILPNIKKLHLGLFPKIIFSLMANSWPNLECVAFSTPTCMDSCLTGLDISDTEFINHRNGHLWRPVTAARLCIYNLPRLRVLSIQSENVLGYYSSGVIGIAQIANLQELRIECPLYETQKHLWNRLLQQYPWKGTWELENFHLY